MHRGFVKAYRALRTHPIWDDKPFARGQAWMDLLLNTNFKEGVKFVRGNKVIIPAGSCGLSLRKLGERWGWSKNKVAKFVGDLEEMGMVRTQKSKLTSLIYIENWQKYQAVEGHRRDTEGTQKGQDKECKEPKKEPKDSVAKFTPPTIEEVAAYCQERNNGIDAEHFVSHYEARGWILNNGRQMKKWKAAIVTWEKNEAKKGNNKKPSRFQDQMQGLFGGQYEQAMDSTGSNGEHGGIVVVESQLLPDRGTDTDCT